MIMFDFFSTVQVFVVSLAEPRLPLQIEDASRPETDEVWLKHYGYFVDFHCLVLMKISEGAFFSNFHLEQVQF